MHVIVSIAPDKKGKGHILFFLFLHVNILWVLAGVFQMSTHNMLSSRFFDCVWGLTIRQPLWVILCRLSENLFVCVEVLRPSQPNGVMSSVVSLPNHTFTGQA